MQTIEKKSLRVGKYVKTAHVDNVIRNYKQNRWIQNSERIGKEDSLSAWWSIEEVEEFLAKAKDHGADGVKFYFAAYDQDHAPYAEFADRQTLVMVGTKQKETATGVKNKDIYIEDGETTTILAYNESSICPPFCGGGATGEGNGMDDGIGITIIDKGEKGMLVI
jgi:hypothetical protein